MNLKNNLLKRIEVINQSGQAAIESSQPNKYKSMVPDSSLFEGFRTMAQSFILDLYDKEHPYYKNLTSVCKYAYKGNVDDSLAIINNIKLEIENNWLVTLKDIVSAEIFTDFIEMAEHLLESQYKDAAAVMVGSVLEEHLRQLCNKYNIDTYRTKDGKQIPLKADVLNAELNKKSVYNKLDQKNITAQLDLRNKAAHGLYSEYDISQVEMMKSFVVNFISRINL